MTCHGNGREHCCYFQGEACVYVEENTVPGRRWACGLLRELGSWDGVLIDERYIRDVAPKFEAAGLHGMTCKGWPKDYPEVMKTNGPGLCCYYGEEVDG